MYVFKMTSKINMCNLLDIADCRRRIDEDSG